MAANQPLSVFISSNVTELTKERLAVQEALAEYSRYGWLWEKDAGTHPKPIGSTFLKEVEGCDIYIGLFWLDYDPHTIKEYEHACKHQKPCLIYEKHIDIDQRNPKLQTFLDRLQNVKNLDGLTIYRFTTSIELAEQVQKDVIRLLVTLFRESRKQPLPLPTSSSTTTSPKNKGIAINQTVAINE